MNTDPSSDELKPDLTAKGIWQQLPNESSQAYSSFTTFLEMGPHATLSEVAAKTGKSLSAVWSLSSRYQWFSRASALRQHFAAIGCHALEKATEKNAELWAMRQQILREQDWDNCQNINALCHQAIKTHLSKPVVEMEPYELRGLYQLGSRLGHQATAPVDHNLDVPSDRNSDPIIQEFRAHLAKVSPLDAPQPLPPPTPDSQS